MTSRQKVGYIVNHQSFDEYPEIVLPAINQFLKGSWPTGVERVTTLNPASK